jgi:superfamily II helicase
MKIEDLEDFGISESIVQKLGSLGFTYLMEVQEKAMRNGLFEGKSLVVDARTNAGKTFIGELAVLVASRRGRRAFYLVPLKAIAESGDCIPNNHVVGSCRCFGGGIVAILEENGNGENKK